jgi:hypothetical protein
MLVVALGIPLANNIATRIAAANVAKDDRLEPGRQRPPTIEFVVPPPSLGSLGPLMDAPCDAVCQRLLLGREVEWVRVSAVSGPRTGSRRVRASQVYSLEAREPCPQAFADAEAVLPETQQAQAQGNCITANGALENLEKPAGASVVKTSSYRWIFPGRSERVSPSPGAAQGGDHLDAAGPREAVSCRPHRTHDGATQPALAPSRDR